MRKFILTLMASLLSCSAAFAFWPEATDSSLEIGVGYRQDKLEWKTRAESDDYYNYGFPFRLGSHLKWRDLQIWQIEAKGKYVTCDNIYLRASGDYGWIVHGKNRDTDSFYISDVEFEDSEYHRSHGKAKGHVYDAKIAVGYQFRMCDDSFAVSPLVGYSWHGQHIDDRHHHRDSYFSDSISDYAYGFSRRHGEYHTRWNGPFIGFDFDYRFGCGCEADWEVFGGYEFHWACYHAKADWHLRRDLFDGFHHRAKHAYGHVFDIGIKWDFCECWTLALKGEFQWWWAHHGRDRAKFVDASFGNVSTDCFLSIPLRDVRWHSASVSVDVGMVF